MLTPCRPAAGTSRLEDLRRTVGADRGDPDGGRRADRHHARVSWPLAAAGGAADRRRAGRPRRSTGTRTRSRCTSWTTSPATQARVRGRVAGSENLGTTVWFKDALTRGAVDVVHFDMAWIGGLTEGRKVAALAEAFDRPIAPHDCTGPVDARCQPAPDAGRAERADPGDRARLHPRLLPGPRDRAAAHRAGLRLSADLSGLGLALLPDLRQRPDAKVRRSAL